MKVARFMQNYYEVGERGFSELKYEAGKEYQLTNETKRLVVRGIAEPVDVPDEPAETVKTLKLKKA